MSSSSSALGRSSLHEPSLFVNNVVLKQGAGSHKTLELPTEVWERVIDFVGGEHQYVDTYVALDEFKLAYATIQACALTCRAWVARSRRHLFRFLGVRCQQKHPRNLHALHALLAREPYLQPLVQALLVSGGNDRDPGMHAVPVSTPPLLPAVRVLRFARGALYLPPAFPPAMRRFRAVTDLYLFEVAFHSVHDLRRTVGALVGVRSLMLQSPVWHAPCAAPLPAAYPRAPPGLRLARINVEAYAEWLRDRRSVYFVEWLARSGAAAALSEVLFTDMMVLDPGMAAAVQSVVEACRDSVELLGLSWGVDPAIDVHPLATAVARCPKLKKIRLRLPYETTCLAKMAHLLAGTCESKLEAIAAWFIESKTQQPDEAGFAALDDALQAPQYKKLRSFVVHYYSLPAEKTWEDESSSVAETFAERERRRATLRRLLPRTSRRGILYYS